MNIWIDDKIQPTDDRKWKHIKSQDRFFNLFSNVVNADIIGDEEDFKIQTISIGENLGFFNAEDIVDFLLSKNIQPELIYFHGTGSYTNLVSKLKKGGCNAKVKTIAYGRKYEENLPIKVDRRKKKLNGG